MANRMVRVESEVFVGVCWVYGKYLFLDFPGPSYEHLNRDRANIFRSHVQRLIVQTAQPNSNVIEGVPLHLRIPQK